MATRNPGMCKTPVNNDINDRAQLVHDFWPSTVFPLSYFKFQGDDGDDDDDDDNDDDDRLKIDSNIDDDSDKIYLNHPLVQKLLAISKQLGSLQTRCH